MPVYIDISEEDISEEDISENDISEEDISNGEFSEEDISEVGFSEEYIQRSLREIDISGTYLRQISKVEIHFLQ